MTKNIRLEHNITTEITVWLLVMSMYMYISVVLVLS